jgi:LysM repeat protein
VAAEREPGSGKVHEDTPAPIKVKKGVTLYSVARKADISADDLA